MKATALSDIVITEVADTVRLLDSPVGVSITMPERKRWGVVLKTGGRTVYTAGGRQIISDSKHPVILPRGCNYAWTCLEPGQCLVIEFDALHTDTELYSFHISDNSPVTRAFEKISRSLVNKAPAGTLGCKQELYRLLQFLVNSAHKEYAPSGRQRLVQPAVDYMNARYFEGGITNDRLAALCGISTVHFRKTFQSVYSVSPIKYLNDLRLGKARSLLASDYASIGQIAESVGFAGIYHFSKMFKLYTGLSPSEYAKTVKARSRE